MNECMNNTLNTGSYDTNLPIKTKRNYNEQFERGASKSWSY